MVNSRLHKIRGKMILQSSQIVLRLIKDYVALDEWHDHELAKTQLNNHLIASESLFKIILVCPAVYSVIPCR
jgi:hypothetical protein